MSSAKAQIGVTGLAVMGRNLARNLARNGFRVALHNRSQARTDALVAEFGSEGEFVPSTDLAGFVESLEQPRKVIIMVKAGAPTDAVIDELVPLLDEGDIVVDAGKIVGQEVGPLSDYIAMLAISQGLSYDACQSVPTITNLMAPDCSADMKPAAITDVDMTYLRGLYKMRPDGSYMQQRGSIAFEMKKDLGGY